MNIRDYFSRNKTKTVNKIKILELLGFEPDIEINSLQFEISDIKETINSDQQTFEELISITEDIYVEVKKPSIVSYLDTSETSSIEAPTDTFNPSKITEQIQRVWSDLETRRKWVLPSFIGISTLFVIFVSINTYLNYKNAQTEIIEDAIVVTSNSNELIDMLPTLIEISTNTFYSKYDVSNASANLQQIESSLIEYRTNLESRNDIDNKENVLNNLNNVFLLVNELDLVITYRILISEVLIYEDLPVEENQINIDELTIELSGIIAQSKVNFSNLPVIDEFNNHKNLVEIALVTAEDLHGRYLAALRNSEFEVAKSIVSAINLNKSTEIKAFENSLEEFNNKSLNTYNNFEDLP
tara:strand:- start:2032 stop:3096 length:1065 start_codon:yes stop_codon:yes gene_type:complete